MSSRRSACRPHSTDPSHIGDVLMHNVVLVWPSARATLAKSPPAAGRGAPPMLIPQESPCPECGHARRDHEFGSFDAAGFERCNHCGCTATTIDNAIVLDLDAPPHPFDWTLALATFVMELESEDGLFIDTIEKWEPGYTLQPGEREDLRSVELIVRGLWMRHKPKKPGPPELRARNVAEENAAVVAMKARRCTCRVSSEARRYGRVAVILQRLTNTKRSSKRGGSSSHGGDRAD